MEGHFTMTLKSSESIEEGEGGQANKGGGWL